MLKNHKRKLKESNHKKANFRNKFVTDYVQMLKKSETSFLIKCKNKFQKMFWKSFFGNIQCVMIGVFLCVLVFAGCGRDVSVLKNGAMEESSDTEYTDDNDENKEDTQEEQEETEAANQDLGKDNLDKSNSNVDSSEVNHLEESESSKNSCENLIYVDLGGAIMHPGVYSLTEGSRVFELIALAGGFTEDAYTRTINQAEILTDGEQIYVYTIQEAEELLAQGVALESSVALEPSVSSDETKSAGKVNLNQADKEALMTLSGIGATRADAILQYRLEHGKFDSIEELMRVEGIKEKTYEKIKDCITVQ